MKRILLSVILLSCFLRTPADERLHIEYAGDGLTEKERLQIEQIMNYQTEFYSLFGLEDSLKVKLTVFEERSEAMFYLDTIGISKTHPLNRVNALYDAKRKEAIIMGMEKDRKKTLAVIYHELSHYLTRQMTGINPPMWFMEGLSEYFEHCEAGKKGIRHSMTSYEKGRIRTMYMLGEVNLKEFIDADRILFMKKQRTDEQYAYVLSHALATFIIENIPRQIVGNFIGLLQDKTDKDKASEKIARVYPGGFDAFETDFEKFCK